LGRDGPSRLAEQTGKPRLLVATTGASRFSPDNHPRRSIVNCRARVSVLASNLNQLSSRFRLADDHWPDDIDTAHYAGEGRLEFATLAKETYHSAHSKCNALLVEWSDILRRVVYGSGVNSF
jgi:hypothetical protein